MIYNLLFVITVYEYAFVICDLPSSNRTQYTGDTGTLIIPGHCQSYPGNLYRDSWNRWRIPVFQNKWNKITPSTLWSKVDHSTIFGDKVLAPRSKGSSKEHTKYIPTLRSIRIWMIDIHHSLNYIRENAESRVSIGISTTEVA